MKLSEAKKIKIGSIVTLKDHIAEHEVTDIDKSLTTKSKLYFWSFNIIFNHKKIETIVKNCL